MNRKYITVSLMVSFGMFLSGCKTETSEDCFGANIFDNQKSYTYEYKVVEGKNVGKVDHSTYHVFHEGNETRMDRISEGADDDGSSTYFEFHPNSKLLKKVALKSSFVGRNFGNEVILDATLIAGEPKTYVSVSEIIYGGQTILDETKSKIIEYLGTEDITTPAGTFTTCKTKITETSVQMSGSDGGKLNVVEIVEWRTKGSGSLVQSTAALPEKGYKQTKTLTAISSI